MEDFRYDSFRRRIAKFDILDDGCASCPKVTGRRYIYDGWTVLEERVFEQIFVSGLQFEIDDSQERVYVNGREIDEPVLAAIDGDQDGDLDGGGVPVNTPDEIDFEYYFLCNQLGSLLALLDQDSDQRILEF